MNHFLIKQLGDIKKFLSVDIERFDDHIQMSHSPKITKLLQFAKMMDCKPISTPIENFHLTIQTKKPVLQTLPTKR